MSKLRLLSLMPLTLCFGCLASLLTIDTPKIETTELEKVEQEISTYFTKTQQVYSNADATVTALSNSKDTYKLTASDYQAMMASVVSEQPFVMPKHLNDEESAALSDVVDQAKKLQYAVTHSVEDSSKTAVFLTSKTKTLEQELVTLRSQYELIKRNPLTSRRDKGRAANKIRKANKLGESIKAKAIKQHKELAQLQKSTLTSLKGWALTLKDAGSAEINSAATGIRDQKNSMLDAQKNNIKASAMEASQKAVDGANAEIKANAHLMEDAMSSAQAQEAALKSQLNEVKAQTNKGMDSGAGLVDGAASTVKAQQTKISGQVDRLKEKAEAESKAAKENAQNALTAAEASAADALSEDSIDAESQPAAEDQ
jgi:hypothetical protein